MYIQFVNDHKKAFVTTDVHAVPIFALYMQHCAQGLEGYQAISHLSYILSNSILNQELSTYKYS